MFENEILHSPILKDEELRSVVFDKSKDIKVCDEKRMIKKLCSSREKNETILTSNKKISKCSNFEI